jgi:hypothetical protein
MSTSISKKIRGKQKRQIKSVKKVFVMVYKRCKWHNGFVFLEKWFLKEIWSIIDLNIYIRL